jgi:hypothetical protein
MQSFVLEVLGSAEQFGRVFNTEELARYLMIAVADGMVSTKTAQRAINDSDLSNYFQ